MEPFNSNGMNGIIGGLRPSANTLYFLWFRDGSIADSNSENIFLNLFGNFSHVKDNLLTVLLIN